MVRPRFLLLLPLTLVLLFTGIAPASASFTVLGTDPAGDSTEAHPGRDIVKVGLNYNRRTGHLRGGVMLRGTPGTESAANLTLFAGRRTGSGCNGFPAIGFGTQTDLSGADWVLLGAGNAVRASGSAIKLHAAATEEYEATARPLAGKRPNCVIAALNDPGNPDLIYDVAGPYAFRALPELRVNLGRLPARMTPGRSRAIRVTVRNPGDARTGPIRLVVPRTRGLTVRMPKRLGSIRPGARRSVKLRVTLNRRARTFTSLRVRALGRQRLRASDSARLYLRKRSRPARGNSRSGNGSQLCFRYTWLPPYSTLVPC